MPVMSLKRKIICVGMSLIFAGCAHYPDNPRLSAISPASGYRYSVVRPQPVSDKPFVLLAFSGGGTRAAAFSFGLMEELRQVEYTASDGSKRRLLDDVEIVSSVSGGSFTSAYYALFPDSFSIAIFREDFSGGCSTLITGSGSLPAISAGSTWRTNITAAPFSRIKALPISSQSRREACRSWC